MTRHPLGPFSYQLQVWPAWRQMGSHVAVGMASLSLAACLRLPNLHLWIHHDSEPYTSAATP